MFKAIILLFLVSCNSNIVGTDSKVESISDKTHSLKNHEGLCVCICLTDEGAVSDDLPCLEVENIGGCQSQNDCLLACDSYCFNYDDACEEENPYEMDYYNCVLE